MRTAAPAAGIDLQAAQEADARRMDAIARRVSFMTETVMSDTARWLKFFQRARQAGYHIALYFVTTADPAINVARVAARVVLGGHAVPENRIRSRYVKVMDESLPAMLPLCDRALLFDNSAVEHGPLMIAEYLNHRLQQSPDADTSRLALWLAQLQGKLGPT